jgi:threonine synthase
MNQPSAPYSSIKNIFFKNESQQPTWSFKDRGTVAAIQQAISR